MVLTSGMEGQGKGEAAVSTAGSRQVGFVLPASPLLLFIPRRAITATGAAPHPKVRKEPVLLHT